MHRLIPFIALPSMHSISKIKFFSDDKETLLFSFAFLFSPNFATAQNGCECSTVVGSNVGVPTLASYLFNSLSSLPLTNSCLVFRLSLEDVQSGIYFVRAIAESGIVYTQKVVVSK